MKRGKRTEKKIFYSTSYIYLFMYETYWWCGRKWSSRQLIFCSFCFPCFFMLGRLKTLKICLDLYIFCIDGTQFNLQSLSFFSLFMIAHQWCGIKILYFIIMCSRINSFYFRWWHVLAESAHVYGCIMLMEQQVSNQGRACACAFFLSNSYCYWVNCELTCKR